MTETRTTTRVPYEVEYLEQGIGGILYRCDIHATDGRGRRRHVAYTTNGEGQGLFYHDGTGDRRQIAGTCQFKARSLPHFTKRVARMAHAAAQNIRDSY